MFNLTPQERNVALFLVVTLAVGSGVLFFKNRGFRQIKPELVKALPENDTKEEVIMIHLAGAVFQPGLYRVKKGSRLGEMLQDKNLMAQADISNMNLARPVSDGERILIPLKSTAIQRDFESSSVPLDSSDSRLSLFNINRAAAFELSTLPGIGQVLAGRIVEYRREFGSFKTKEELKKVRGIGEKRFEKIKDLISAN